METSEPAPGSTDAPVAVSTRPPPAGKAAIKPDSPIDPDHAADLFASLIAQLEEDKSEDIDVDFYAVRNLRKFKARQNGGDAAQQTAQVLRDHLNDWLGQFPRDQADRLALVSGECRAGGCRILIAQKIEPATGGRSAQEQFAASTNSFSRALTTSMNSDWWQQFGAGFLGQEERPAGGRTSGASDHALWTIYVSVPISG